MRVVLDDCLEVGRLGLVSMLMVKLSNSCF